MKWGGLFSYSKFKILQSLDKQKLPLQFLISSENNSQNAFLLCEQKRIQFPLILKPDYGERGKAVAFIETEEDFHKYPYWNKLDIIVQEYIDLPLELGVFWIRDMKSNKGFISSLMERSLLKLKGNGKENVFQLLSKDSRLERYAKKVKTHYPKKTELIPAQGEVILIEPIGNHNRGTVFLNCMDQIDDNLTRVMNDLLIPVRGFNYGRLDIRAASWEDLKSGKNFKVLEVNGANSEPAHIYQPDSSIFEAYKSIFQHWKYIYKIAEFNRKKGMKSESIKDLYRAYKKYLKQD